MSENEAGFWKDETSILFTSLWDWAPWDWGTIGWTGDEGRARRDNLLRQLTDPFIAVCYVTNVSKNRELQGKIAGFYLLSHETGDRDLFTHPACHGLAPDKWRHSVRAIRAFSYLPEYRIVASEFDQSIHKGAMTVGAQGKRITDPQMIARLRDTPWMEVDVYTPGGRASSDEIFVDNHGFVKAGPANGGGYMVSLAAQNLGRELYVLRLTGSADAFLGESSNGQAIYKVGLSISPDLRCEHIQKYMPQGAFEWQIHRTSRRAGLGSYPSYEATVAGENAMKQHLQHNSKWLGGEFYLASESDIEQAWRFGNDAAKALSSKRS